MKTSRSTLYFAVSGIIGSIFIMIGDYLLEYLGGLDSQTIGPMGIIETAWKQMPTWRFTLSLNLAAFSLPLCIPGYIAVKRQMERYDKKYAALFYWSGIVGLMGGMFLHGVLCLMPIIYKSISGASQDALALIVIEQFNNAISPAFWIFYIIFVIVPPLIFILAVLRKKAPYHKICLLFNSIAFLILALVLSAVSKSSFDLLITGSVTRGITALFIIAAIYEIKSRKDASKNAANI